MREFLVEYVVGYCILGTLLGSIAYLYLCVRLYDVFQRHYPQLVDNILGAMDSNIGQEFRAITVMPPLLRSPTSPSCQVRDTATGAISHAGWATPGSPAW